MKSRTVVYVARSMHFAGRETGQFRRVRHAGRVGRRCRSRARRVHGRAQSYVALADESLRLAQVRYRGGVGTLLELQDPSFLLRASRPSRLVSSKHSAPNRSSAHSDRLLAKKSRIETDVDDAFANGNLGSEQRLASSHCAQFSILFFGATTVTSAFPRTR
jgi:hypothetical protein